MSAHTPREMDQAAPLFMQATAAACGKCWRDIVRAGTHSPWTTRDGNAECES